MKASELIAELQKYPPDLVVIATWEGQGVEFEATDITKEHIFKKMAPEQDELQIDVDTWGKSYQDGTWKGDRK